MGDNEKQKKLRRRAGSKVFKAEFNKIIWPDKRITCKTDCSCSRLYQYVLGVLIAVLDIVIQYGS